MFQVDPDAVMFATGKMKPKAKEEAPRENLIRPKRKSKAAKAATEGDGAATEQAAAAPEADEGSLEPAEGEEADAATDNVASQDTTEALQHRLRFLARNARKFLDVEKNDMSVKRKRQMRAFVKRAKDIIVRLGGKDGEEAITQDLVTTITNTLKEMVIEDPKIADRAEQSGAFTPEETAKAKEAAEAKASTPASAPSEPQRHQLSDEEQERLAEMVREYEENPVDLSKPYKTPWEPRPFMSPFAFIPRYLEVNQNICAAVYLRHPVARQGMAEIPSPFPPSVQELAFNWYLRRR